MARISAYTVSRVVFAIVGVLVAATIVIGVIYSLHNRGVQVRHDQASQIADQELKQQQAASTSSQPAPTSTNNAPVSTPTTPPTTVAATGSALPKTGMSDDLRTLFVLALLTFAATSFIVSRQRVKAL